MTRPPHSLLSVFLTQFIARFSHFSFFLLQQPSEKVGLPIHLCKWILPHNGAHVTIFHFPSSCRKIHNQLMWPSVSTLVALLWRDLNFRSSEVRWYLVGTIFITEEMSSNSLAREKPCVSTKACMPMIETYKVWDQHHKHCWQRNSCWGPQTQHAILPEWTLLPCDIDFAGKVVPKYFVEPHCP